jgi:hypothetical protein
MLPNEASPGMMTVKGPVDSLVRRIDGDLWTDRQNDMGPPMKILQSEK